MSSTRPTLAAFAVVVLAATSGLAQEVEVELVANLNQRSFPQGSGSDSWVAAGGRLYFQRFQSGSLELWRTDGTAEGTELVRELDARSVSTRFLGGELPDGRLLFPANDPVFGIELWISGGPGAETRFFADLCPGSCDSQPGGFGFAADGKAGFVRFGDELLFTAFVTPNQRARLFATDGGAARPRRVTDIAIERWLALDDQILLLERPLPPASALDPWKLWVSGGTPDSERLVQELALRNVWSWVRLGPAALLIAQDNGGEFVVYFGDAGGLQRIATLSDEPGRSLRALATGPGLAYVALDHERKPCRLYRTDGTPAGTFELAAVAAVAAGVGECVDDVAVVGDRLFFDLETRAEGRELWTSDGTEAGTGQVTDILPGRPGSEPSRLTAVGSRLYFFATGPDGQGLWTSDGTAAGTAEVRAFQRVDGGFVAAPPLGVLDGRLIFAAGEADSGLEVWTSDGTAAGTRLVAKLSADEGSSNPRDFIPRAGDVVFRADSELADLGLFSVDAGGAVALRYAGFDLFTTVLGRAGDRILLEQRGAPSLGITHVLSLDVETGDVVEVAQVSTIFEPTQVGDLFFFVTGGVTGSAEHRTSEALWVTDGTPQGTTRLFENENPTEFSPWPSDLLAWGGSLFFVAESTAAGAELWRTDGTRAGTRMALDLRAGTSSSSPDLLAASDGRLFLRADLGGQTRPLLVLDSALRIERRVDSVEVYPSSTATLLGGRLLWLARRPDGLDFTELWASDGTETGTTMLADLDKLGPLTVSGARAYFAGATRENGLELWATDGTAAGTGRVRDIEPGPASSAPTDLRDVGGTLVFAARTAAGTEPWRSDGTREGTRLLADVAPGPASSRPADFLLLGDRMLFAAERPDVGRELFAVARSSLVVPCTPGEETLCLAGGRFAVEADWTDFQGAAGKGRATALTSDTGFFYFFSPANVEVVVKVLDGCGINGRFWVFAGGLTNVRVTLTVTDVESGQRKTFENALGAAFQPIQDTSAFATCP